jgi:hypothetical protein
MDVKEIDKPRITAAKMKFLTKTTQYTWYHHKQGQDIMKEHKTTIYRENK